MMELKKFRDLCPSCRTMAYTGELFSTYILMLFSVVNLKCSRLARVVKAVSGVVVMSWLVVLPSNAINKKVLSLPNTCTVTNFNSKCTCRNWSQ